MEASLPRECELAEERIIPPLWRLFGLLPRCRRRSRSVTAFEVPRDDRSVVGCSREGFSLRFEAFPAASAIES
jgi:hypothetical protein